MDIFNGILSKLALIFAIVAGAAAIDIPNNPARTLLRSFCFTIERFSGNMPVQTQ